MDSNSYKLIDEQKTPSYDGTARLYLHQKTGFRVITVDNKDPENFFSYVVYTPCSDSTGVFHIIEHTVLSGSRKYPVKDAFTVQMASGCPTFMNAMTGADRTYYLAASAVEKDFENIFSVYSDAVFDPLLRKETFMQEGIRVSYQGTPHFDGVVFSEMQGATSQHESVLSSLSSHGLFPGCAYEYESGGLPKDIARLSYEEYLEKYRRYYVPSNMCLLIYGSIEKGHLMDSIADDYLDKREYVPAPEKVKLPPLWKEMRKAYATSAASDPSSNGKSSVLYSWRLNDSTDGVEGATLQVLTDMLLGSAGCPLYKAITECPYSEDISTESGMIWDYSAYAFAAGMAGVGKENCDKAASYLMDALKRMGCIAVDTSIVDFRHAFSGVEVSNPIRWTGTKSELSYLIRLLCNTHKVLQYNGSLWRTVCTCFVDSAGNTFDANNLRDQKKPKLAAEAIEKAAALMR